jgi:hypothetical protein
MHELHTDIEIAAPPQTIWAVLTDLPAYGRWNPFIRQVYGDLHGGTYLEVSVRPPGARRARLRPKVLVVAPPRELCWRAYVLMPEVLEVEQRFLLGPTSNGEVHFKQSLRVSGLIAPLLRSRVDRYVNRGIREMNAALKGRVERACRECASRPPG